MPFGITSAPEHFQHRMSELLRDIEEVVVLIDNILVTGRTKEEHDRCLGIEKCEFDKPSVKFVGQMVDQDRI